MHESPIGLRSLTAVTTFLLALAAIAVPATASAGEPATVTVRVESFEGATLLAQMQVTTTTAPVSVEGSTCSGTSAGGALYDAVKGNWKAVNSSSGVEILGIDGVNLPPFGSGNYAFWSIWVNDAFAKNGACTEELSPGADVVYAAQCFATGPYCPTNASAPEHFLTSTRPNVSTANINEPVSLKIGSISTENGEPETKLPPEVTVSGGPAPVIPQADGTATVTFPSPGLYTLQAHAPGSVPSDPQTICVHNGNDGNCGTTKVSGSNASTTSGTTIAGSSTATAPYKGPYALVAKASSVVEGHVYERGHAPRILSGSVLAHTTVTATSLELRREYKGRCYAYNGVTTRFARARCGEGSFFKVSNNGVFSYLLPAALPPGRYVLDIEATDAAGNSTTLARGTSRIVFYVK